MPEMTTQDMLSRRAVERALEAIYVLSRLRDPEINDLLKAIHQDGDEPRHTLAVALDVLRVLDEELRELHDPGEPISLSEPEPPSGSNVIPLGPRKPDSSPVAG